MSRHYILCHISDDMTDIRTYKVSIPRFWWPKIILMPVIDCSGDSLLPLSDVPCFLAVKHLVAAAV